MEQGASEGQIQQCKVSCDEKEGILDYQFDEEEVKKEPEQRNQKKSKIQLMHEFRQLPEQKSKRKQKQKLRRQRFFQKFTPEDFQKYYFIEKHGKEIQERGLKEGMPVIIDCGFQKLMSEKEQTSMVFQILQGCGAQKRFKFPLQLHIIGNFECDNAQLMSNMAAAKAYKDKSDLIDYIQPFRDKYQIVYLSPDAERELEDFSPEKTCLVIGGLVDRSRKKGQSVLRAQELKVECRSLPITQYINRLHKLQLNIDSVIKIINNYLEFKDWEKAFHASVPHLQKTSGSNPEKQTQATSPEEGAPSEAINQVQK